MRTRLHHIVAFLLLGSVWVPNGAVAATFEDPEWPCIQRKVLVLSIGQMWPGPMPEGDWRANPAVVAMAPTLAVRRTPIEQIERLAAGFAAEQPAETRPEQMAQLFAGVLDHIGLERGAVIAGIGRFAHKQADLAALIETREAELASLNATATPDMDRIEELRDTLNWDIRIFRERAQSLTYVCETPVLLEQRAFAIARILAGQI